MSLTVGNGGENHTGMEFLGSLRRQGRGGILIGLGMVENFGGYFWKQVDLYNLNELCLEEWRLREQETKRCLFDGGQDF